MSDPLWKRRKVRIGLGVAVTLVVSSTALGLPWDVDMADSQAVKAYEREMLPPPDGTVAQPSPLSPRTQLPAMVDRNAPEANQIQSPFPVTEASLALGEQMYGIYCTPCHGMGSELGPVAQPGRLPGVLAISGPRTTLGVRSDGFVYLTIKNGGAIMPDYGWAMSEQELWATVHYLRSLPNNTYTLGGN